MEIVVMRAPKFALGIALLLLAPLELQGGNPNRSWQTGELLSRKTVPVGRTFLQNRFVYRIHGYNCWYVVMSETPLKLDLYTPMKFAAERNQVIIQDADGTEHKTRIIQKTTTAKKR